MNKFWLSCAVIHFPPGPILNTSDSFGVTFLGRLNPGLVPAKGYFADSCPGAFMRSGKRGHGCPYGFSVAVAQARGARRLRRFRVGQSKGPCQIPLRSASADGEAASRPRSCRIGSWRLNTYCPFWARWFETTRTASQNSRAQSFAQALRPEKPRSGRPSLQTSIFADCNTVCLEPWA